MAFDFPPSPTPGALHKVGDASYEWRTDGYWRLLALVPALDHRHVVADVDDLERRLAALETAASAAQLPQLPIPNATPAVIVNGGSGLVSPTALQRLRQVDAVTPDAKGLAILPSPQDVAGKDDGTLNHAVISTGARVYLAMETFDAAGRSGVVQGTVAVHNAGTTPLVVEAADRAPGMLPGSMASALTIPVGGMHLIDWTWNPFLGRVVYRAQTVEIRPEFLGFWIAGTATGDPLTAPAVKHFKSAPESACLLIGWQWANGPTQASTPAGWETRPDMALTNGAGCIQFLARFGTKDKGVENEVFGASTGVGRRGCAAFRIDNPPAAPLDCVQALVTQVQSPAAALRVWPAVPNVKRTQRVLNVSVSLQGAFVDAGDDRTGSMDFYALPSGTLGALTSVSPPGQTDFPAESRVGGNRMLIQSSLIIGRA